MSLTRISRKVIRKNYHGKANYESTTLWLYIPKRFHELLQPHTNQELDMDMHKENGKILIELTPRKS